MREEEAALLYDVCRCAADVSFRLDQLKSEMRIWRPQSAVDDDGSFFFTQHLIKCVEIRIDPKCVQPIADRRVLTLQPPSRTIASRKNANCSNSSNLRRRLPMVCC